MKIHLPNSAFLGNIDPFLRGFDVSEKNKLTITSNQRWISIHPVVLTMIAALGMAIDASNIKFESLEARSKHYLQRMGLFKFLRLKSPKPLNEHESSGRFIPLTQINDSKELTQFITEMTPLLHLDPKHAEPIRYIMSELIRNVLEHAASKYGAIVCAQYHVKSNTIRIGISDTGLGILKTINRSHKAKNDLEAIALALTPGITGTTSREGGTEFNAGAGLFFIKSIATVNRDFFMIYSGNAIYKLLKRAASSAIKLHADPFEDRHSKKDDLPYWQGTTVGIDISLDNTREFSAILDLIRGIYTKAIQERKKEKYKKPIFV